MRHRLGAIYIKKKHWSSKGNDPHWTSKTNVFFCKLLLNGASHDTKIGCISLVWAGAKKYKFSCLLDPLRLQQLIFEEPVHILLQQGDEAGKENGLFSRRLRYSANWSHAKVCRLLYDLKDRKVVSSRFVNRYHSFNEQFAYNPRF